MAAGWYAERLDPFGGSLGILWMPCLRVAEDLVAEIRVSFDSKEACEAWMQANVVGRSFPLINLWG